MASPTLKKIKPLHARFGTARALRGWGRRFARLLRKGDVVALIGPLGAGKTTLTQGIVEGLGYDRGASSPTFALVHEYRARKTNVYHMDMYRLSPPELRAFPLEDYWDEGICLIEWAERVRDRWPEETVEIKLSAPAPRLRTLTLRPPTPAWSARLETLRQ